MTCWLVARVGGIDGGRLAAVVVLLPAAEGRGGRWREIRG